MTGKIENTPGLINQETGMITEDTGLIPYNDNVEYARNGRRKRSR